MDSTKRRVADAVQSKIGQISTDGIEGNTVEFIVVDKLNTQLRVRDNETRLPRYFLIKVSEQY